MLDDHDLIEFIRGLNHTGNKFITQLEIIHKDKKIIWSAAKHGESNKYQSVYIPLIKIFGDICHITTDLRHILHKIYIMIELRNKEEFINNMTKINLAPCYEILSELKVCTRELIELLTLLQNAEPTIMTRIKNFCGINTNTINYNELLKHTWQLQETIETFTSILNMGNNIINVINHNPTHYMKYFLSNDELLDNLEEILDLCTNFGNLLWLDI